MATSGERCITLRHVVAPTHRKSPASAVCPSSTAVITTPCACGGPPPLAVLAVVVSDGDTALHVTCHEPHPAGVQSHPPPLLPPLLPPVAAWVPGQSSRRRARQARRGATDACSPTVTGGTACRPCRRATATASATRAVPTPPAVPLAPQWRSATSGPVEAPVAGVSATMLALRCTATARNGTGTWSPVGAKWCVVGLPLAAPKRVRR